MYFSWHKKQCARYGDKRGTTLIDILIATFIFSVVFVGISGVLLLATKLVGHTKARIGATALANESIEYARSLPYASVGTAGGIPAGPLPQTETIVFNGISYTRRILIQYVDDPKDGLALADQNGLTADYKRMKVELSWALHGSARSFSVLSNMVPKGVESIAGGGTLRIDVIDALGAPIAGANVHIENDTLVPPVSINTSTNVSGTVLFPGSPAGSSYEITVTRAGMSTAQTYDTNAGNPNPNPPHLSVIVSATTATTFQIDFLGSKTVRTLLPVVDEFWEDLFNDTTKIFQSASTTVAAGALTLAVVPPSDYEPQGYAISHSIAPSFLVSWASFSWNDMIPASTAALYRLYYINSGNNVIPIPDSALPGNAVGFTSSPISLAGVNPITFPQIQAGVTLSTLDASTSPTVFDWRVNYRRGPVPVGNLPFTLQGEKTIGTTGAGAPIYKYNQPLQTNAGGTLSLPALEYDVYNITVGSGTGYDIGEVCPPQPFTLNPGVSTTTNVFLVPNTAHTLLVVVKDGNGGVLSDASVHLYGSGGIDRTQTTSGCGQTFFSALPEGTVSAGNPYSLSTTRVGYQPSTSVADVDVSGVSQKIITLTP